MPLLTNHSGIGYIHLVRLRCRVECFRGGEVEPVVDTVVSGVRGRAP